MIQFNTYVDKTKEDLTKLISELEELIATYCPEWHIVTHNIGMGIIYHLYRHDFSACNRNKGIDKEWPVDISQVPFAIERPDGVVQIADVMPIQLKSTSTS